MNHLARALISAVSSHGRSSYPVKWSNLDAAAAAVVDDDDDDDDGGNVAASLANRFNRRKSVFAESYDPEGDDDEGEKVS